MPINPAVNLPSVLPNSKSSGSVPSSGIARAQNFSISKLNQKKDLDNAKVSMNQLVHPSSKATTSVSRVGNDELSPTTSVAHLGDKNATAVEGLYNEEANETRYHYGQRLAMQKRANEKAKEIAKLAEAASGGVYEKMNVKTGSGFRMDRSVTSFRRQFYRLRKLNPVAFKNISDKDQKYFFDLVKPYVKGVGVGKPISRQARREMKYKMEMDRRKGIVSKADVDDLGNLISNLPHA